MMHIMRNNFIENMSNTNLLYTMFGFHSMKYPDDINNMSFITLVSDQIALLSEQIAEWSRAYGQCISKFKITVEVPSICFQLQTPCDSPVIHTQFTLFIIHLL